MRRQTIAIVLVGLALFGVGLGAALGVVGNEKPRAPATSGEKTSETMSGMEPAPSAPPAHTMPGGMTMTGMTMPGGMTMTGMTMPAETATAETTQAPSPPRLLSPERFADAVADPATVTINVHVPREGSIFGTDLWIPYDRIARSKQSLPARSTPLAVYCRSGRMSAIAVRALARMGYTRIVELRGGMEAWVASGKRLSP